MDLLDRQSSMPGCSRRVCWLARLLEESREHNHLGRGQCRLLFRCVLVVALRVAVHDVGDVERLGGLFSSMPASPPWTGTSPILTVPPPAPSRVLPPVLIRQLAPSLIGEESHLARGQVGLCHAHVEVDGAEAEPLDRMVRLDEHIHHGGVEVIEHPEGQVKLHGGGQIWRTWTGRW